MQLPETRGPLSAALCDDLTARSELSPGTLDLAHRAATTADPLTDDDLQLALAVAYELHYRGFDGVDDAWEWAPSLLELEVTEDILLNVTPREARVGVVENGMLQEVHIERTGHRGYVGNIYCGRVRRVMPGMQAAFVDIGLERSVRYSRHCSRVPRLAR